LLSIVTQALLCNFLVSKFLLSRPALPMSAMSGNSRFLRTGFRTGARHRRRVVEGGLRLLGEVNALYHRVKLFHKHVLSFEAPSVSHPCNLELKCNN
jgi:hypothetical protein